MIKKVIDSIGLAIEKTGEAFDKNLTTKEEVLEKVKDIQSKLVEARLAYQLAEANGNWMQRSWRPITGLVFAVIVIYNKFLGVAFGLPVAELEAEFWNVFQITLGIFGLTRGLEKTVNAANNIFQKKKRKGNE